MSEHVRFWFCLERGRPSLRGPAGGLASGMFTPSQADRVRGPVVPNPGSSRWTRESTVSHAWGGGE
eukprot:3196795-Prorocentrum_lima.AAC.1